MRKESIDGSCIHRQEQAEAERPLQVPVLPRTATTGDALLGELMLPSFPAGHSALVKTASKKRKIVSAQTLIFRPLPTDNQLAMHQPANYK